jgi:type I restriction enzyme S subunit
VLLDRAIELRREQRALLEERRWALFLEDVGDAQPVPLRRVVTFMTDGPFGSAFTSADYAETGAAVIRLGNIGFGEYRPQGQVFIPETLWREFPRCHVRAGDLLVASLGDPKNHAGRACVAPELGVALVKGKCFCVRVDERLAWCDYIALMLSSPTGADLLSVETRGATRGMINLDILRSVSIPLPTRQRQEEITRRTRAEWENVRRLSSLMAQNEGLLQERKQALITAAVTGEFDVTTARWVA